MKKLWAIWLTLLPKMAIFLKLFKASKFLVAIGSMGGSVLAYGWAMGSWIFAFGLVGLLLIHELGHVWAARRYGVKASWPIFIPFIGAAIFIKKFASARTESFVAIAGPVVGSIAALLLLIPYELTGSRFWLGLVYLGVMLNAFNLIPLRPLDGGRMTAICGRWFKYVGIVVLTAVSLVVRQPVMLYVWILILSDVPFPQWWRTITSCVLTALMITLMICGYSNQGGVVDSIDISFACAISLLYYARDHIKWRSGIDKEEEVFDNTITTSEKYGWAMGWLAFSATLGTLLWFLADIGPN